MTKVQSREEFLIELNSFLPIPCLGVELGVLRGEFSAQILSIINPERLYLVDPFESNDKKYEGVLAGTNTAYSTGEDYVHIQNRFKKEIKNEKVFVRNLYSHQFVSHFPNETWDFVYHDASHRYEDLKRDLNDWLQKLKPDGLMCGHDYIDMNGFGVKQAVNEFMEEHGFEMIIFNENGGDFALKRK